MNFLDAHCHLSDPLFDPQRAELYESLRSSHISGLVLAGTTPADWKRQCALDPDAIQLVRAFGVHPWFVDTMSEGELEAAVHELEASLADCSAIGEIGYDYFRAKSPDERSKQRRWFERQLDVAQKHEKPLILHMVRAHHDALPILRKRRKRWRGLVHSFWTNLSIAEQWLELGFTLSIPPRILYGDQHGLLSLPPESYVFESDSPAEKPEGGCTTPLQIIAILTKVAELRKVSLEEAAGQQAQNLKALFPELK